MSPFSPQIEIFAPFFHQDVVEERPYRDIGRSIKDMIGRNSFLVFLSSLMSFFFLEKKKYRNAKDQAM